MTTHVEFPFDFVHFWLCSDGALEVDVVALFDVLGLKGRAEAQGDTRQV